MRRTAGTVRVPLPGASRTIAVLNFESADGAVGRITSNDVHDYIREIREFGARAKTFRVVGRDGDGSGGESTGPRTGASTRQLRRGMSSVVCSPGGAPNTFTLIRAGDRRG